MIYREQNHRHESQTDATGRSEVCEISADNSHGWVDATSYTKNWIANCDGEDPLYVRLYQAGTVAGTLQIASTTVNSFANVQAKDCVRPDG